MGTSFTNFPSLSTHLLQLCVRHYALRIKRSAEASELSTHVDLHLVVVVGKTTPSDCILQGAKKMEVGGC